MREPTDVRELRESVWEIIAAHMDRGDARVDDATDEVIEILQMTDAAALERLEALEAALRDASHMISALRLAFDRSDSRYHECVDAATKFAALAASGPERDERIYTPPASPLSDAELDVMEESTGAHRWLKLIAEVRHHRHAARAALDARKEGQP